jgi:hypothetical protein
MSEYSGFILVNRNTWNHTILSHVTGCRKTQVSDCTSSTVITNQKIISCSFICYVISNLNFDMYPVLISSLINYWRATFKQIKSYKNHKSYYYFVLGVICDLLFCFLFIKPYSHSDINWCLNKYRFEGYSCYCT